MSVRYRERALSDLEDIAQYLEPRSAIGARNVLRAIHAAVEHIERHPHSAIETSMPGIRVWIIGRYRYKIFYALAEDRSIEVIHIRHAAPTLGWCGLIAPSSRLASAGSILYPNGATAGGNAPGPLPDGEEVLNGERGGRRLAVGRRRQRQDRRLAVGAGGHRGPLPGRP
jgi:plasmid stabilization system protein ParE